MSTYRGRRRSPQRQSNSSGNSHGNVYPQTQHGVEPGRRADGADWPFPNKPVSHRPPNSRKDNLTDLHDFEKMTITQQPASHFLPQKHRSNGVRKTSRSQDVRKDSQPSGELQMARAIHTKQLILQEKLWSVEEKIRNKMQRDAAACDDPKSEEWGNPRRRAERNIYEEERDRRESQRGAHHITAPEKEEHGGLNKSRWDNVKEHARRKGGTEKQHGVHGGADVKPQGRTLKERQQYTTAMGDMHVSEHEPDKAAPENLGGAGGTVSDPTLHGEPTEESAKQQLLPCTICNRTFTSVRLQKHIQICEKVKRPRRVFNSYLYRTRNLK